jgi:hypothetical protein
MAKTEIGARGCGTVYREEGFNMKVFTIFVDDEAIETAEHKLTVREVLTLAGISPDSYYLVEVNGKHQVSFQNKLDETVNIHEKAKFVTVSTGPTPVS